VLACAQGGSNVAVAARLGRQPQDGQPVAGGLVQGERHRFAGGAAALIGHFRTVALSGRPRPAASTASVGAISAQATSFRYHAEEMAKAHILTKHPDRMSAFCLAALGTRFPGLPRTGAEV
jgi:hypothetical protein